MLVCRHLLKEVTQRLVSTNSAISGESSSQFFYSPDLLRASNSVPSTHRDAATYSSTWSRRPSVRQMLPFYKLCVPSSWW